MSFIGKVGKCISFSITLPGNTGSSRTLYESTTFLTNGKMYLVTAEVSFARNIGSGYESTLFYFTNGSASNTIGTCIGIPFAMGLVDQNLHTAYWSSNRDGVVTNYPRNSAQALISNGLLKLICVSNYVDDQFKYDIQINAIEVSATFL